jgi:hypothetical protein
LVNSIANLISLIYCVGPSESKSFNFIVGGDDFLVSKRKCSSGALEDSDISFVMENRSRELGMQFKFLLKKDYNSEDIEGCPVFYKYCIYKNKPMVPTSSVLERSFIPWNRNYSNNKKYIKFLWDLLPSLGTPGSHLLLFYKTYVDLVFSTYGVKLTFRDVVKSHTILANKMFVKKVIPFKHYEHLFGFEPNKNKRVGELLKLHRRSPSKDKIFEKFIEGVLSL